MSVFRSIRQKLVSVLEDIKGSEGWDAEVSFERVTVEPPRDPSHGDIATNAAMVLAKAVKSKPRDLAEKICAGLSKQAGIESVEVAGPGFINMRLDAQLWLDELSDILLAGISYGDSTVGAGEAVNVEYVSANPTGPLHAAHARGAVFGDALAALLEKAGFAVSREYYINDSGAQVEVLSRSAYHRYREALGENVGPIPEGQYPGEYLKDVGKAIAEKDGDKWVGQPESAWLEPFRKMAVELMMKEIEEDLLKLGVKMARFSSERELVYAGAVDKILETLEEKGLLYTGVLEPPKGKKPDDWEPRPQLLFKSTEFGDDIDRPLKKSDSSWTYFSNDIAYHLDKYQRGFAQMIDVWGADHGGYVKRMKASVSAVTGGEGELDVKLCQIVHLLDGGKPVRMSKRAGTFVTLRDILEAVGPDVLRFIMLTRKNDQTLEFDYQKVKEQSRDNPVFYVQYAHARACSVIRRANDLFAEDEMTDAALSKASRTSLTDEDELGLIKLLAGWPRLVESAAEAHEPHRIAFYLGDVAAAFHGLWNKGRDDTSLRFIQENDSQTTKDKLALVRATALVIASGLAVIGVTPAEELRDG